MTTRIECSFKLKHAIELKETTNSTATCILPEFIFNSNIIDGSDHWSLLLFKESLAIRHFKPKLKHGTNAIKELIFVLLI